MLYSVVNSKPSQSVKMGVRWVRGVRPSSNLTSLFWEVWSLVFRAFENMIPVPHNIGYVSFVVVLVTQQLLELLFFHDI